MHMRGAGHFIARTGPDGVTFADIQIASGRISAAARMKANKYTSK